MNPSDSDAPLWSFQLLRPEGAPSVPLAAPAARSARSDGHITRDADAASLEQRGLISAAERELELVHRAELASLLRAAAGIRARQGELGGLLARSPGSVQPVESWRRSARSTLELARNDGLELPGLALVATLASQAVSRWPSAVRLARLALELLDGERARVTLGFALLAGGEPDRAARVFAQLLRAVPRPRRRGEILEGLAAAHADLGRLRLALGAFDQAADDPGSSVLSLVSALQLAFLVGDVARAGRAAARLDLLVDPASPEFSAALGRSRSWMEVFSQGRPWRPRNETEPLFRSLLLAPSSPAGRVCRFLG